MDWWSWHKAMDDPTTPLGRRLAVVQDLLARTLDGCPPGPIRVISLCAGQGRDLIEVLSDHPRRNDVSARLVELDPRNAAFARASASAIGLKSVEVEEVDASTTDSYTGAVPANIILSCGVFGNITGDDIRRTIKAFPSMCAENASVIWTRNRFPPDLTPQIRKWFEEFGFEEIAFEFLREPSSVWDVTALFRNHNALSRACDSSTSSATRRFSDGVSSPMPRTLQGVESSGFIKEESCPLSDLLDCIDIWNKICLEHRNLQGRSVSTEVVDLLSRDRLDNVVDVDWRSICM